MWGDQVDDDRPDEPDASVDLVQSESTDDDDDDDDHYESADEYDDDYILSDDEYYDTDLVEATIQDVVSPSKATVGQIKEHEARKLAQKNDVISSYSTTDIDFINKSFEKKVGLARKKGEPKTETESESLKAVNGTLNGTENTASVATTETHTHVVNFKRSKKAAKNKLARLLNNRERRLKRGENVSRLKLILKNCQLNGITCTALIDDGADVSGIKPSFVQKHKSRFIKNQKPSTTPLKCVNETPLAVSKEYHDVEVKLESFEDFYDFHGFDMGGSYDFLLGVDWLSTYRAKLDHDPLATEKVKVITNESGQDVIHVLSTVNVVTVVEDTVHCEDGVYTPQDISIGAVSACVSGVSQNTDDDSISLLSHKQFKKERKKIHRQQNRQVKHAGTLGVKGAMVMMISLAAVIHGVSSVSLATSSKSELSVASGFIGMVCSVAAIATQALVGTIMTNVTEIKRDDFETSNILNYRKQVNKVYCEYVDSNETHKSVNNVKSTFNTDSPLKDSMMNIIDNNPLLPAPQTIISQVGITVEEAKALVHELMSRGWECCKEMPHKSKLTRRKDEEMHIEFAEHCKDYVPPPKTYRTPVHLLPKLEKFLKELLELGIIRKSTSPFCSPVLMVPKPHQEGVKACDLKYRMCVSLKDVNALTVPQHHRIPNINSIWSTLGKAKYLSVIDLAAGFYQMNNCIEDGTAAKTAFGCEFGHFEFVGCVMGAKNTPAHFQNNVEKALKRHNLLNVGMMRVTDTGVVECTHTRACVTPYVDDLVCYSDTLEQHMEDLERLLKCLSDEQYYIKPEKCAFCCKYVTSLGSIVGNGILACAPEKIESVIKWEKPTDITSLRSFLGMCNYLKPWYEGYARTTKPLSNLLKKGTGIKAWDSVCDKAFNDMKYGFMRYPILRLPDFNLPMVVVADSCDISIGGAIMQMHETPDGSGKQLLPVSYYSRLLTKHELNYPIREKECLALHDVFKKNEYLLIGSKFKIACHTDHSSLLQLCKSGPIITNRRLLRWLEYFSGFDFEIFFIPGKSQLFGDGVSRSLRSKQDLLPCDVDKHTLKMPAWVCGVNYKKDERLNYLDYTHSKQFSAIYLILTGNKTVNLDATPSVRHYEIISNDLYYHLNDGNTALCVPEGHFTKSKGLRTRVPLREALLRECHDSPYMGHRGTNKTYLAMRKLFYWPKMARSIDKYVRSCKACNRAKASTKRRICIHPNECPKGPFHSITMDFIVQLPEINGKSQVLVVVDRFTKKLFTIPMKGTATAIDVAHKLYKHVFMERGLPLQIISDRDTKFVSKIWKNLFEIFGTTLTFSYSYHQRFDGQTEVMNRVIEEVLRTSINYTQTNWLKLLPEATCAINNSVNVFSNMSPNQVYYGCKLFMPIDLKFGLVKAVPTVKDFLENLMCIRHVAAECVRTSITRYTTDYNSKSNITIDPRLKVGARVYLKSDNIIQPGHHQRKGRKLQDRNLGPFTIVDTIGKSGFELDMPGYKIHKQFSADSLIPTEDGQEFKVRQAEPEPDHFNGQEAFYEVDHLAARKTHYRYPYYFVIYKGYGVQDGEWMSESLLVQDCPQLVQDYKLKFYDTYSGTWKDPVGIKNAKNNPTAMRGRGSTRGRGRPRGRPRGRARGSRYGQYGRGASDLVKVKPVVPVKAKPTRRSTRNRQCNVSIDSPSHVGHEMPSRLAPEDAHW